MTFLPVIERELRVQARSRTAHVLRGGAALLGILICLPQLLAPPAVSSRGWVTGNGTFTAMALAGFTLCCGAAVLTAEGISTERREGTLGLLLLTRVKLLDLLLGKMGAAGVKTFGVLIALLPLLAVPAMAGGVTGGEVLRIGLALLNCLFCALTTGLLVSVYARRRITSLTLSSAGMILLIVMPLLMAKIFPSWLASFSPLQAVLSGDDFEYKRTVTKYWQALVGVHVLSWALLVLAVRRLRWLAKNLDQLGDDAEWQSRGKASRVKQTPFNGEENPIEWLVRRQPGLKRTIWAALLLVAGYRWLHLVVFFIFRNTSRFTMLAAALPDWIVTAIAAGLLAWGASRFFIETRRTGELELLLTAPRGKEVVSSQWRVLKKLAFWPLLVLLACHIAEYAFYSFKAPGWLWRPSNMIIVLIGLVNVVLSLAAVCWMGMWFGWKARGQARAILWTLLVAKCAPMLLGVIGSLLFSFFAAKSSRSLSGFYTVYSIASQIFVLLLNIWLIRLGRRWLYWSLAGVEAERYGRKPKRELSGLLYRNI